MARKSLTNPQIESALHNPRVARRVKLIDRTADGVIRLGGIGVIGVVALILVFLALEAWPLFRGASQEVHQEALLPGLPKNPGDVLALGLNEYETHGYFLDAAQGAVQFFDLQSWTPGNAFPLSALANTHATCAYRAPVRDKLFVGTADGRVVIAEVSFRVDYGGDSRSVTPQVGEAFDIPVFEDGSAVRLVHGGQNSSGDFILAAVSANNAITTVRIAEGEPPEVEPVGGEIPGTVTHVALDFEADKLFAATDSGRLVQWYLSENRDEPFRTYDFTEGSNPARVTAMDFVIGDVSILLGFSDGRLEQWCGVREKPDDYLKPFHPINTFRRLSAPVGVVQPSGRDKGFLAGAADGTINLDFTTSRRTLLSDRAADHPIRLLAYAPKLTSYLALAEDGQVRLASVHNPHPEISWRVLFGKVLYEGYDKPEYVWQSTGGTDDFESKLSLVPLLVGTLKGALFGLIFAVPVAIAAALYTSQFMPPGLRSTVKPTVEIMAALPSVVIGFLAGLWLAPMLEKRLVMVFMLPFTVGLLVVVASLVWFQLPRRIRHVVPEGWELAILAGISVLGVILANVLASPAEALFFAGNFKQWVFDTFGHQVEQRNSIVIGVAMGFAVIPIIFTISEDAFSNVPPSFRSASFALGASTWQTAWRVILPTASPGVFSAVMIGFGRAVGETMIVLMATGNTPILSFSPFNGMRTLSANIAVEIPEAPAGGTLYRVLFVAALLLFALTFIVNTVAEIVRQRLRQRYQAV